METLTLYRTAGGQCLFWEVTWDGREVEIAEGEVGTEGDITTRHFTTTEDAERFVAQQLEAHRTMGFAEDIGSCHGSEGLENGSPSVSDTSNRELEAKIVATPDDPEPYRAYAEWLRSIGDPLGELIRVQQSLRVERTQALERAEQHLFAQHGQYFFGGLSDDRDLASIDWSMGFMVEAALYLSSATERGLDSETVLRSFLSTPAAKLLHGLAVMRPGDDWEDASYEHYLRAVVEAGYKPLMSRLQVGGRGDVGHITITDELLDTFPKLRELILFGSSFVWPPEGLDNLESLTVSGVISKHCVTEIAARRWSSLRELSLDFCGYALYHIETLEPLFAAPTLPSLEKLAIRNTELGDELCTALSQSCFSDQLMAIELSSCKITATGVKTLVKTIGRFQKLEAINLASNDVGENDVDELLRTVGHVDLFDIDPYSDAYAVIDDGDDAAEGELEL